MKIRKAASSLTALLVLAAAFQTTARAYAPASDAAFTAELGAISSTALKAAQMQRALAASPAARSAKPDSSITPGKLCTPADADFDEYRYTERIAHCRRHVTAAMKREVAARYGVPRSAWSAYQFDHLIPLSLGGGNSLDNLWPQPDADNSGEGSKDKLEGRLFRQLRDGEITQAEAVRQIFAWFDAYRLKRAN